MKEVTLEQFLASADASMEASQLERILVTRDGEPYALVVGIAYKDQEDFQLEADDEFWAMIEERRKESGTIPLEQLEAELLAEEQNARNPEPARRS